MSKIAAVLLDLNGVVEDTRQFEAYRENLIRNTLAGVANHDAITAATNETRELLQGVLQHALPEFHLVFWDEVLRRCGGVATYTRLEQLYGRFLDAYLPTSALYPDVTRFLAQVGQSVKLGILSNANSLRARRFLEYHGIHDGFDVVTVSHDTPCTKPDRELFLLAAARFDVSASEILMVGDRIDNDANGAQAAGMRAVLLCRNGGRPDYKGEVATDLDEVRQRVLGLPGIEVNESGCAVADMVAVIVCAGRGTRLADVTRGRQKCLTDIQGKPILLYVLDRIVELGVRRFDFIAGVSATEVEECVRSYLTPHADAIRFLPIVGESTGGSIATYWRDYRDPNRDVLYTHGNIIVQPAAAKRLVIDAMASPEYDVMLLANPEWVAETHPGIVSRNGRVVQINTDVTGGDRRGLCSVGMAIVRRRVNLAGVSLPPKWMFEDIVDRERTAGRIVVGSCFSDAPWEHLGTPADFARLNEAQNDPAELS